ncbi:winged helix-turn-helix transcriptional regulator [Candidatus Woesearchaeota archaeon]|nr:winged helix-turn-helix transcriptional regulator [Candidatus Woesearchaeota archaeon]
MEFEDLLTNSKWNILSSVAKEDMAASDISKATGTSLANISQQAKLLEAWGLIKRLKASRKGPGKPKIIYGLNKELAHIAVLRDGFAGKKMITPTPSCWAMLNIFFHPKQDDHYYLQKFLWQCEDYVEACDALAIADSDQKEIHILAIASPEKLEALRKKYSKVEVKGPNGKKTVISWTHSEAELAEGLAAGEDYFENLLKHPHIITDPNDLLKR